MTHLPIAVLASCLTLSAFAGTADSNFDLAPVELWRVVDDRPAPWHGPGEVPSRKNQTWRIGGSQLKGWQPLQCGGGGYVFVLSPAEGLFQGNLPAPADTAATALGIDRLPVPTQQIVCDTGLFDLHRIASDRALLGLDGRVLELQRESIEDSPLAAAMEMVLAHTRGDMGLTKESVARKAWWLTPELEAKLIAWLARPQNPDEAPNINGDPFTNSQEYPDRFRLGAARISGSSTEVPVEFDDGHRRRPVILLMRRVQNRWRVDDLRYEDGSTLRKLL